MLKATPSNPRQHGRPQIRALARSIKTFGFTAPILVDKQNQIIGGHGRTEAAKLAGLSEVPVIRLEHLSDTQARAYMLADNKLAERSSWDEGLLAQHLKDLQSIALDFDIEAIGFEPAEIDLLVQSLDPPDAMETADEFATPEGPPISRVGDLWSLGPHRLICDDAQVPETYSRLMQGKLAAAVFTDPPYNVRIDGHATGKGRKRHREFAMASGEMNQEEFVTFLFGWLKLARLHADDAAVMFMCMDWRHTGQADKAIEQAECELINICVWVKTNGGMGSLYRSRHEFVLVFRKRGVQHQNNVQLGKFGRNRTNVWNYPGMNSFAARGKTRGLDLHPTVKPVGLVADAILDVTTRGDIVLDPFCGSGTTILAAERTGRAGYGIELEPTYVDVTIRRWQAMTGQVATRHDGKTFDELAADLAQGGTPAVQDDAGDTDAAPDPSPDKPAPKRRRLK